MGARVRLYGRMGRVCHARKYLPSGRRPGGHGDRHGRGHGHHAGHRQQLFLPDGTQRHHGRHVFLHQGGLRAGPRVSLRLVSLPVVSDHRVPQRHRAVLRHPLADGGRDADGRFLHHRGQRHLPRRDAGLGAGAGGRGRAVRGGKAPAAAAAHGAGRAAVCGRGRDGGDLQPPCRGQRRPGGLRLWRHKQGLCGFQPDHSGPLGLCGLRDHFL